MVSVFRPFKVNEKIIHVPILGTCFRVSFIHIESEIAGTCKSFQIYFRRSFHFTSSEDFRPAGKLYLVRRYRYKGREKSVSGILFPYNKVEKVKLADFQVTENISLRYGGRHLSSYG